MMVWLFGIRYFIFLLCWVNVGLGLPFGSRVSQIVLELASVYVFEYHKYWVFVRATAQQSDYVHVRLERLHDLMSTVEILNPCCL